MNSVFRLFYRWGYLISMYSGVRALSNGFLSRLCFRKGNVQELHRTVITIEGCETLESLSHTRVRPPKSSETATFGMISLRRRIPEVGRWRYRYLCLTTHFGCGHMELAFYREGKELTFYGVRNTARSNAERLGWAMTATKLRLATTNEESTVLLAVKGFLESHGYQVRLAPSEECVRLCLSPLLLNPGSQDKVRIALRKKYERMHCALDSAGA